MVDRWYGNGDCRVHRDYREILASEDLDAVCIAVPDHWHVLIGLEAVLKNKHLYFEKPVGLSIEEAKIMRDTVRRTGVVFQFGTQQRSDDRFRLACELVRNGRIGTLETIMIGSATYDPVPDQPVEPVPEGFDYDFWLGPAPSKPYTQLRCTRNWTLISDYSLGCVSGAWGIHQVDIAQWANDADMTYPTETEGWGTFPDTGLYDTAVAWEVRHRYANGVELNHMDMRTALKRAKQFELFWMGILMTGSEGWIYVARDFIRTYPEHLVKTRFGTDAVRLPKSSDHRRNFLDAIRGSGVTVSPIESAVRSDIICHHADIAMKLGRKLKWDPEKEVFIGDPEANRMMRRPMRAPWHL